jgi:predicted small lipoprotein YifL
MTRRRRDSLSQRVPKAFRPTVIALLIAVAGCGEKGPPRPPEPRGPFPPEQVRARQVGSAVLVGFVVPVARSDKVGMQPQRAELVRVSYPPHVEPSMDANAFRRRGELVNAVDGDPLSPGETLTIDDPTLRTLVGGGVGFTVRYGVRVRDRRGRPSPLVVAKDVVIVASSVPPANLRGEPTADGIRLAWDAPAGSDEGTRYNLYRPPGAPTALEEPLNADALATTDYLDTNVDTGEGYTYLVRTVLADGRPFRESEDSNTITLIAKDLFPPAPPGGLVAVQEGRAVRLFWDLNDERDLAGYRVYRQSGEGERTTEWTRVGPDPVERQNFLDESVRIGEQWRYRVTAIDRAIPPNESGPSEPVEIELLEEPAEIEGVRPR